MNCPRYLSAWASTPATYWRQPRPNGISRTSSPAWSADTVSASIRIISPIAPPRPVTIRKSFSRAAALTMPWVSGSPANAFAGDPLTHGIVNAAARENDFRMVTGLGGAIGEIIRIDADTVSADQAGLEVLEIPFGRGCRQYVAGVDAQALKYRGQFIHERDVEIALGVFD